MFVRRSALFFGAALALLLVIEGVLRLLPVAYPSALTAGFGVGGRAAMHQPGAAFVYSRDWDLFLARRGRIGPYGFHGVCEPTPDAKTGVFIAGDSYTEAIMLEPERSIGGRLKRARPELHVCAAGMSGANASEFLSQFDEMNRLGKAAHWVVVLNRYDLLESYSGRAGLARFPENDTDARELVGDAFERPGWLVSATSAWT
jgi:hypothetical protein